MVFDLGAILLTLKDKNILTSDDVALILAELELKDYYKFSAQKKRLLLGTK